LRQGLGDPLVERERTAVKGDLRLHASLLLFGIQMLDAALAKSRPSIARSESNASFEPSGDQTAL
jgi:hypothetical protein